MKKILMIIPALLLAGILFYACQNTNVVETSITPQRLYASVTPTTVDPWKSGNSYFECSQAGGTCWQFAYKVDDWNSSGKNGTYDHAGNTITITNSNGKTFDWSSVWPVCKVIVKAGTGAYIYNYEPGVYNDASLSAPENKDISHVTFCFTDPDNCYQEETAWAGTDKYNNIKGGNWATYFPYPSGPVLLFAGKNIPAGSATFSTPVDGSVTITITLTGGFIFYYNPNDSEDDNLKVQDYAEIPSGNPSPGQFVWKKYIESGETTATILVPVNYYYGLHLDVAYPFDCD
jgi:hypothetical protein